jgi:hypothetical protein
MGPPSPPAPSNSPPLVTLSAISQSYGVWKISGHVMDEEPSELTVRIWGGPLGSEVVTVDTDAGGDFVVYRTIVGGGIIYAQTQDDQGLSSNMAATTVGF